MPGSNVCGMLNPLFFELGDDLTEPWAKGSGGERIRVRFLGDVMGHVLQGAARYFSNREQKGLAVREKLVHRADGDFSLVGDRAGGDCLGATKDQQIDSGPDYGRYPSPRALLSGEFAQGEILQGSQICG